MSIISEFKDFLKEYKVIGLAVAFIMGVAATSLVKSMVDNIIMPLVQPLLAGAAWKTATWTLGPFIFGIGAFAAEAINFIIIAFVIFLIAKLVLKEDKVAKK